MIVLSIIIPVYNVEKYIVRCLSSIISQADDRMQIIIVDDGCSDASISKIEKLCSGNRNVEVYHKQNGGLSSARNHGIKKARGKYIYFVDSDDYIAEGVLAPILDKLQECDGTCFVFDHLTVKQYMKRNLHTAVPPVYSSVDALTYLKNHRNPITNVWKIIVSRSLIVNLDLTFRNGVLCEDIEWLTQVLLNVETVIISDCVLYIYNNERSDSIMNVLSVKRINDIAANIGRTKEIVDNIEQSGKRRALKKLLFVEWCMNLTYYSRLAPEEKSSAVIMDCFKKDNEILLLVIYNILLKILKIEGLAALLYRALMIRKWMRIKLMGN